MFSVLNWWQLNTISTKFVHIFLRRSDHTNRLQCVYLSFMFNCIVGVCRNWHCGIVSIYFSLPLCLQCGWFYPGLLSYQLIPSCDIHQDFRLKTMFDQSYLQLFVEGLMSYLRYLCLVAHGGVQHILHCVFVFIFSSS